MQDVIADQHYWFDADGNVTTDEAKGTRWLAREGANVLPEHRDALKAFQGTSKEEGSSAAGEEVTEKATSPKANKSAAPTKNKGVK